MKWFLGAIVIVAVAVLVVIRPAVIWWLVAGAVLGALIFIGSRRGWKAVVGPILGTGVVVLLASGILLSMGGAPGPHRAQDVRAVPYSAQLQVARGGHAVTGQEVIRVSRALLTSEGSKKLSRPRGLLHVLGPGWRYDGARGPHQDVYAFVHPYSQTLTTASGLSLLAWNSLPVPVVRAGDLRAALVPQDGSVVELRTPRRAVYDTDPDATRRTDGGEDVLDFKLSGLEDSAADRHVDIHLARGIARNSVYAGLRDFTAWKLLTGLLSLVLASVVGFFVNRWLENRVPKKPQKAVPAEA